VRAAASGASQATSSAELLGRGDTGGDQLGGYSVRHLGQRRSSVGVSWWCGWRR